MPLAATALVLVGPAGGSVKTPSRVQVLAREYSFALSRTTVREGNAIVELANFGQDPHDLHVEPLGRNGKPGAINPVPAGQQGELLIRLKPGRYQLYCSLADHRALGMNAVLVVKSR